MSAADKPAAPARRGPRYPCEDLEIDPVAPAAPKPAFERTLPIEGEYFEEMLQSWSFLNTFGCVQAGGDISDDPATRYT